MGFSEKMRESLGAEGARVQVAAPQGPLGRGESASISVNITGGTRAATIDGLIVRIVEADRHWTRNEDGQRMSEEEVHGLSDRRGLTAGWDRRAVSEHRVDVGQTVEPHAEHDITVEVTVPEGCKLTAPYCSHTLNVQADIKGQIDPTGNVRVTVGE